MLYAMLTVCATLMFVLAVPSATKARRMARPASGTGGVGRNDGPPRFSSREIAQIS